MPEIKNISDLLDQKLLHGQFKELPNSLNLNGIWFGRRLKNPGTFTIKEARTISNLTDTSLTVLMDDYGLCKDTLTANEADVIRAKELTATKSATDTAVADSQKKVRA